MLSANQKKTLSVTPYYLLFIARFSVLPANGMAIDPKPPGANILCGLPDRHAGKPVLCRLPHLLRGGATGAAAAVWQAAASDLHLTIAGPWLRLLSQSKSPE